MSFETKEQWLKDPRLKLLLAEVRAEAPLDTSTEGRQRVQESPQAEAASLLQFLFLILFLQERDFARQKLNFYSVFRVPG